MKKNKAEKGNRKQYTIPKGWSGKTSPEGDIWNMETQVEQVERSWDPLNVIYSLHIFLIDEKIQGIKIIWLIFIVV